MDLVGLALRVSVAYFYVLILLRLSGKQSIGALSPLDFVVATMLGDFFDDIFWAEVPLLQGLTAIAALLAVHTLATYLASRHTRLHVLIDGTQTPVLLHGQFLADGLHRERTSTEEVLVQLRLHHHLSEEDIHQVRSAAWETDGQLSVQRFDAHQPLHRADVPDGQSTHKG